MNLLDGNPALRRRAYQLLALVGLVLGAIGAWYGVADGNAPEWHAPALAVLAYVGAALGYVAQRNVTTGDDA